MIFFFIFRGVFLVFLDLFFEGWCWAPCMYAGRMLVLAWSRQYYTAVTTGRQQGCDKAVTCRW